ncbi:hypothetical protein ACINK0_13270 [Deinococcus sp. VB343]|uniref:Uncharacterized protein n=1 Tax=Deinococcus sp. VB142 TaxID=3112952 RepID=A0AAU6Q214_9DEIO
MKKVLFVTLCCAVSSAFAQQSSKVVFAPLTVDGVTTPNGLVTINGKTYVSVDALKARGATVLKTGSLGLYSFPTANGVKTKLTGCNNEWLTDGVHRLRMTRQYGGNGEWNLEFNFQSSQNNVDIEQVFQTNKVYVHFKDGKVLEPMNDPFAISRILMGSAYGGEVQTGHVELKLPDAADSNPAIKVVLRPIKGSPWTVDLTCGK